MPTLTGQDFRLQFVFVQQNSSAGILTAYTSEFTQQPSGLILNDTLPHTLSGMAAPTISVKLTDQNDVFVPQLMLPDPQKAHWISVDLFTARYMGCSRHRPFNMSHANWSTCARMSALAKASFFYLGPDSQGLSLCGYDGSVSEDCSNNTCWHNVPVDAQCSIAVCGQVAAGEEDQGAVCNASYGFRFFVLQNSSSLIRGQRRAMALGGQALFNEIRIPTFYGKASCMLLFSHEGNHNGTLFSFSSFPLSILLLCPLSVPYNIDACV